mmetsp:Transcript_51503/g.91935  ORF Transcript_51503/g.91935 Transcript_51503/m.91935 type:complete len:244 (-) Transcript_51503:937-1668(-)
MASVGGVPGRLMLRSSSLLGPSSIWISMTPSFWVPPGGGVPSRRISRAAASRRRLVSSRCCRMRALSSISCCTDGEPFEVLGSCRLLRSERLSSISCCRAALLLARLWPEAWEPPRLGGVRLGACRKGLRGLMPRDWLIWEATLWRPVERTDGGTDPAGARGLPFLPPSCGLSWFWSNQRDFRGPCCCFCFSFSSTVATWDCSDRRLRQSSRRLASSAASTRDLRRPPPTAALLSVSLAVSLV